jgi:hypothetical protein
VTCTGGYIVRDEEAAGSNPATPTQKSRVDGLIARCGGRAVDRLSVVCPWDRA